jgi:3-oxoacyl-[acyl-carrier protein] reductase
MKRLVVITGGTKGLGREMALAFGRAGYRVVVFFASDEVAAAELRALFTEAGVEHSVLRHDVSAEDAAIWERVQLRDSESITLIHNACASFSPTPLHQLRWPDCQAQINVSVKGAWVCAQAMIRPMLQKGHGAIVNVLTSALHGPCPKGFAAYLSAKHALQGFTLALAAEYAARGVRVFSVSPGFMDTALTLNWDFRFRESMQTNASRTTDPVVAARRLVELVEGEGTAGQGEDYPF